MTTPPTVQHIGPYQITPDGDLGWFVLYVEDNEDDEAWEQALADIAGFNRATMVSDVMVELDGQVRIVAEHWTQPTVLIPATVE